MRPARVRRAKSQLLKTPEIPPFVCKDNKQMMELLNKVNTKFKIENIDIFIFRIGIYRCIF